MQSLILVRGLPGSGKSTLAEKLHRTSVPSAHFEADMYFMVDGEYRFDYSKLGEAHKWCLDMTETNLRGGLSVIVSNTFVRLWEMRPYIALAESLGVPVQIVEVSGPWTNVHGVPSEVLEKMRNSWEPLDRTQAKGWEW